MSSQNKKLVMFDFDGVLIDTLFVLYGINTKINKNLSLEEYKNIFTGNIYNALRPDGTKKKSHPEFSNLYDNRTRELKVPAVLKDCVKELSGKYDLAIVSSTGNSSIKKILEREGIDLYFQDILGSDVAHSKSDKIKMLLEKYGKNSEDCVFITDTLGDIREAASCRVESVAVTWGFHERASLELGNPVAIIDDPRDLVATVEGVLK